MRGPIIVAKSPLTDQRFPSIAAATSSLNSSALCDAPFDPDNFQLVGHDLSVRFAVISRSHQAELGAGQHTSKDRHGTFLRLRMRTAKADQSLRTMLSGGQSAQLRPHVAQVAALPILLNELPGVNLA